MTLYMSVHPKCGCTTSSVNELEQILTRAEGAFEAHVLIVHPSGAPADWKATRLRARAEAIPGVRVEIDPDGKTSARLGAETSGHVVVLDADGRTLFAGGITSGRGHEGDSDGMKAVLSLIKSRPPKPLTAPVFGCGLTGEGDKR